MASDNTPESTDEGAIDAPLDDLLDEDLGGIHGGLPV